MSLFSKKSPSKKSDLSKKRSLRVESLEERQMLSINPNSSLTDVNFTFDVFEKLVDAYPSLNLGGANNQATYNNYATSNTHLQVIDVSKLNDTNLPDQMRNANVSVIVIRIDDAHQTFSTTGSSVYNNSGITSVIVWDDTTGGTGTFELVSIGSNAHFHIGGPAVFQFGGINFTTTTTTPNSRNGGVVINNGATVNFDSVVFDGLSTTATGNLERHGAAINIQGNSTVNVVSSQFLNNKAISDGNNQGRGGAIYQNGGTLNVYNTLFARNQAPQGAAVYTTGNASGSTAISTKIVSSTVAGSISAGHAIYNEADKIGLNATVNKEIYNTLFTENANRDVYWSGNAASTIGNTIRSTSGSFGFATGNTPTYEGFNNFVSFAELNLTSDYRLTSKSTAAINKISAYDKLNNKLHVKDADGGARVIGSAGDEGKPMDVGAFEYQTLTNYIAVDDTIYLNKIKPVFDGTNYTFTFDVYDAIFKNDTFPGQPRIPAFTGTALDAIMNDNRFQLSSDGTTVTFTWDMKTFDTEEVFTYMIGDGSGYWSNEATITLVYPDSRLTQIVTTLDDLKLEEWDPLLENAYEDVLLSLRQAIEISNTEFADETSLILFASYLARDFDHSGTDRSNDPSEAIYDGILLLKNGQMNITSNVIICGLGVDQLTIDANKVSRIFCIGDYDIIGPNVVKNGVLDVSIQGMTLKNGKADLAVVAGGWGGAISSTYTNLVLDNVHISDSVANTRGGAISSNLGTLSISNSRLEGNSSGILGGAIWYRGVDANTSSFIDNVEFVNNTATDSGGAISIAATSLGNMTIKNNSLFKNNLARFGGAIDLQAGTLTVEKTTFLGNKAKNADGGAIYSLNSTINVVGSTFTDNTAILGGGAIYAENTALTINDSDFDASDPSKGNKAKCGGGVFSLKGTLSITDTNFTGNSANDYGGALWRRGDAGVTSTLDNVTFTGNKASVKATIRGGGAIYLSDSSVETMTITGSTFTDNTALNGGAICSPVGFTRNLNIVGSTFTGNIAKLGGGAIYSESTNLAISEYTSFGDTTKGNEAKCGGAIFSQNGTLRISDTDFAGNKADEYGGALWRLGGAGVTSTLDNVTFTDNKALATNRGGGAIYLGDKSSETMTITDSTFTGNEAKNGGAIYSPVGTTRKLNLARSIFTDNTANLGGGAIYAEDTVLTIADSDFGGINKGNKAEGGGAIFSKNGTLSISNTNFAGNTADNYGGALWRLGGAGVTSTLSNVTFTGNKALATTRGGGAIYISDSSAETMMISHSLFANDSGYTIGGGYTGNSANDGAGLFVGSGNVVLTNGQFEGNTATRGEVFYKLAPATITLKFADGKGDALVERTFGTGVKSLSEAELDVLWAQFDDLL